MRQSQCECEPRDTNLKRYILAAEILIGVLLFSFVFFRAATVGFTHDESFSFLTFVTTTPVVKMITHPFYSSNNHLLNSICMRFSSILLGTSEWELRLHSVLSYALYLWASIMVSRELFSSPIHRIITFVTLNANMFLLEYFALARGYGLGLGLMMLSLWLFLRYFDDGPHSERFYALSLVSAALAVLANLSYLIYYLGLLLVAVGVRIRSIWAEGRNHSAGAWLSGIFGKGGHAAITSGILAITAVRFAIGLRTANELYYGGKTGFVADTCISLINACLYNSTLQPDSDRIARTLIPFGMCLLLGFYIYIYLRDRSSKFSIKALTLCAITYIAGCLTVLQHHALGTLYLVDRTAMLFIPLILLITLWGLARLSHSSCPGWVRGAAWAALFIIIIAGVTKFAGAANVTHTAICRYDAESSHMLEDLEVIARQARHKGPIHLGLTWYLNPAISYYAETKRYGWLAKVNRDGISTGVYDYFYVTEEDLSKLKDQETTMLRKYPSSGTYLLRRLPHEESFIRSGAWSNPVVSNGIVTPTPVR